MGRRFLTRGRFVRLCLLVGWCGGYEWEESRIVPLLLDRSGLEALSAKLGGGIAWKSL
jgi:hypothetical protein